MDSNYVESRSKELHRINRRFADLKFDISTIELKLHSMLNSQTDVELAESVMNNVTRIHNRLDALDLLATTINELASQGIYVDDSIRDLEFCVNAYSGAIDGCNTLIKDVVLGC